MFEINRAMHDVIGVCGNCVSYGNILKFSHKGNNYKISIRPNSIIFSVQIPRNKETLTKLRSIDNIVYIKSTDTLEVFTIAPKSSRIYNKLTDFIQLITGLTEGSKK